jgi:hypothetical protein
LRGGKGPYWKRGSFRNPDGSRVGRVGNGGCVLMLALVIAAVALVVAAII